MALSEIDFRLVRRDLVVSRPVDLSVLGAVRLGRHLRGTGRDAMRARSRHGERGDRKGDESDDNGP